MIIKRISEKNMWKSIYKRVRYFVDFIGAMKIDIYGSSHMLT